MKNTSLIKIKKETSLVKVTAPKKSKAVSMDSINSVDEKINKIWAMFENQLQRNYDLMGFIDKQQQVIEKVMTAGYTNMLITNNTHENNVPVNTKKEEEEKTIELMSFEKLKSLTNSYKKIITSSNRIDAIHSLLHILHTLNSLGKAKPEQLFIACGMIESTGFRLTGRLRSMELIKYNGTTREGAYAMTELGKDFLDEKIKDADEYRNRLSSHAKYYVETNIRMPLFPQQQS
ncbi:MAG: hypothetical protein ABIT08_17070 [Bacteroidia bacterium]